LPSSQLCIYKRKKKKNVRKSFPEKKEKKLFVVVSSDTITNPKTMMIVSLNTNSTLSAMPCSIVTNDFAYLAAKFIWFYFKEQSIFTFYLANCLFNVGCCRW
jgi:hypothetical protein